MFCHTYFSIGKQPGNKNFYFLQELKNNLNDNLINSPVTDALKTWYQIIFLDPQSPSCQNDYMIKNILKKASYNRWTNWGTFYGYSRFASVMISNYNSAKFLFNHFQTIYYQISVLLFFYRGSLLYFSKESEKIAQDIMKKEMGDIISDYKRLKSRFLLFRNKYWFREITAQDQGIEIFDFLNSEMRNPELMKDVHAEIEELYSYFDAEQEKEISRRVNILTLLGAIFIPFALVTGFFGMNLPLFKSNWPQPFSLKALFDEFSLYYPSLIMLIISLGIVFLFTWIFYRTMQKYYNQKLKGKTIFSIPSFCKFLKDAFISFFRKETERNHE